MSCWMRGPPGSAITATRLGNPRRTDFLVNREKRVAVERLK